MCCCLHIFTCCPEISGCYSGCPTPLGATVAARNYPESLILAVQNFPSVKVAVQQSQQSPIAILLALKFRLLSNDIEKNRGCFLRPLKHINTTPEL
ncbi:hypothetical protein MA16_Dca023866 [Dendrobium catenatum]|uniref:Uncharacterized protein n=1 Tax=Dendrobium catenatum TaxID=906689 RepID=A0A2I0XFL3_9ASPA|nr:hypothetical protein MA16_Dca023866 [Dendrobium catenatum]